MTQVRRSLASSLSVSSEHGLSRKRDVVIRVVVRVRGGVTLDINDGEVIVDLSEGERIALLDALDKRVRLRP
jgi:hypothetical protein